MDKDQEQIIKYQKQKHAEHKDNKQIWCTLCYPLGTSTTEFKSFWDFMKIHYKAVVCNGATQLLFKEMQEVEERSKGSRILNMIESMIFEKHEEIQDNKSEISRILTEEFKKKNDFKSESREGSKERSREELKSEEVKNEEIQSRKSENEEEVKEKDKKNPNIVVNLSSSSRGRPLIRGTGRREYGKTNSPTRTSEGRNYYSSSKGNEESRSYQNIINTSSFASSFNYNTGFGGEDFNPDLQLNNSDEDSEETDYQRKYKPINTTFVNTTMSEQNIKALIERLGGNRVPIPVSSFRGKVEEDPNEWLREYNNAAKAYGWNDTIKLESVIVYLKGSALDWFEDHQEEFVCWGEPEDGNDKGFEIEFIKRFTTQERRNLWFSQFNNIEQKEDESVETYTSKFRKLVRKVSTT